MKNAELSLWDLLVSYKRIKVITVVCAFITALDNPLLLVMLVSSNLNCAKYQHWFQDICGPVYLAFQVVVPFLLGFFTDLTQDYSLEVMRCCTFFYVLTDAMLYFLPYNFPDIALFASPYFVLICFMARMASILQVGNCASKILKMRLDRAHADEETQIAIFNHVGIFADGMARILLILTFLSLWSSINVFDFNLGFPWSESILFSASFIMDILSVAFSFTLSHDYFQGMPPNANDAIDDVVATIQKCRDTDPLVTVDSSDFSTSRESVSEQASLIPDLAFRFTDDEAMPRTYASTINDSGKETSLTHTSSLPILGEPEQPPHPESTWQYFRDSAIVIATFRGGLLRDVNLHLIVSCSIYGFINIVLQFGIIPVQHGTDFRNGFCGGQLMGIFILQIVQHSIFLIGAISYQTVFVLMRPHHFFSRVYILLSACLVVSLVTKYFVSEPFVTSFLYSLTGLIAYWAEAYDSFLAIAIAPADYVGIVGALPTVGNSVTGLLTILYSIFNLPEWITITILNAIAVFVAIYSFAISYFHKDALYAIEGEVKKIEDQTCFSRYVLGYR